MVNQNFILVLAIILSTVLSCSEEPQPLQQTTLPSVEEPVDSDISESAVLYLVFGTRWESEAAGGFTKWVSCEIPANSVQTSKTCTVSVPEARLYFSSVQFKVGTKIAASCPILSFHPHYYRRSDSNAYRSPDMKASDPALDCSGSRPVEKRCYGGAAPIMVESFPENAGTYILTHVSASSSYEMVSSNSKRSYGTNAVNYMVTNDLLNRTTDQTDPLTSRYVDTDNPFLDYRVYCANYWGEVTYAIDLVVSDENMDGAEGGTPHDDFPDWQ